MSRGPTSDQCGPKRYAPGFMPTYEYACKTCGEHLEVVQSFKDDPLTECPNCGGQLRKVFGAIGIAFKGSGFYRNDSRPAPKEAAAKEKSEPKGEKSEPKGDGAKADKGDSKDAKSGSGSSSGEGKTKTPKSDSTSAASS